MVHFIRQMNDTKLFSIRPRLEVSEVYLAQFHGVFTGPSFIYNCFICSACLGSSISLIVKKFEPLSAQLSKGAILFLLLKKQLYIFWFMFYMSKDLVQTP